MKVSRKSIIIVAAAGLSLIAASTVWLVGRRQPTTPDFSDKKSEEVAEYLKSDKFKNLDPNSRRAIARNAMRQIMTRQAKEYCELPPEKQIAYLDKIIDTMQSRRREFESMRRDFESRREQAQSRPNAQDDRRRPRRRGRRRSPERMRARSEFVDPKTRAQMAKFRGALRQRMRERGINFRPPRR